MSICKMSTVFENVKICLQRSKMIKMFTFLLSMRHVCESRPDSYSWQIRGKNTDILEPVLHSCSYSQMMFYTSAVVILLHLILLFLPKYTLPVP